jgi:predicted DNA-binding transcriptional regulator AlpA
MRKRKKPKTEFKRRRVKRIPDDASPDKINFSLAHEAYARPPPPETPFYEKYEVLAFTRRTWPSLWGLIRKGKFPQPRELGGRPIWIKAEIDQWFAALPVRNYKPLEQVDAA